MSTHDIFPIWIFFQASEAVNMQESMMPATVNVPPMIAQIWPRQSQYIYIIRGRETEREQESYKHRERDSQ